MPVIGVATWQGRLSQLRERPGSGLLNVILGSQEYTPEHPPDVGIEKGHVATEGKARDSPRGIAADAGE